MVDISLIFFEKSKHYSVVIRLNKVNVVNIHMFLPFLHVLLSHQNCLARMIEIRYSNMHVFFPEETRHCQ